jgi:regulator of sigma E protease
MLTLLATVVVLGVLIFVHELGHFLAAKSVGIAVLRFSFGLGSPTPLSFRIGETQYCISWIPLGGYVKMAGLEDEGPAAGVEGPKEEVQIAPERTFDAKSLPARMFVISAGVMMNMLFAVLVYTGLTMRYGVADDPATTIGEVRTDSLPMGATSLETIQPGERILRINGDTMAGWRDIQTVFLTSSVTPLRLDVEGHGAQILVDVPLHEQQARLSALRSLVPWHDPIVGDILPGQPAHDAGLQRGDRFLSVNGDTVPAWERLVKVIESHAGDTLRVRVRRGAQVVAVNLVPKATVVPGATGAQREVGKVGLGVYLPLTRYGLGGSLKQGVLRAADAGGLVLFTLKGLLTGQLSPRDLGGPILVGQLSGEAARLGLDAFLGFMALFSMNLAVLNLLPIPVLDGGHLLFLVVEGIRRKPLSIVQRQRFTQVGFFVLLAIMVLALANDITRVFQKLF